HRKPGKRLFLSTISLLSSHTYPEAPVSFSTDGTLALAAGDGLVRIHDGQDGDVLLSADLSTRVSALAWSPEGDALALGSWGGEIIIVGKDLVQVARTWASPGSSIVSLSWQGERIASVSSDLTVRTWCLDQTGSIRQVRLFSGWGSAVSNVQWYPDGISILACHYGIPRTHSYDAGSVRCYGAHGEERFSIEEVSGFKAADLSLDGKMIATVTYQGEVAVWDAAYGSLAARIDTPFARSCRWNPAKTGLLAVFGYNGLEVWTLPI
ncbi:MAG: WD40 repeat domain-containing protein, partial [Anaerolineae bacterium]